MLDVPFLLAELKKTGSAELICTNEPDVEDDEIVYKATGRPIIRIQLDMDRQSAVLYVDSDDEDGAVVTESKAYSSTRKLLNAARKGSLIFT